MIDPNAAVEAQKYDNPIPSREFIMALLEERGKPMTREKIAAALGLEDEEQQEALRRRLRAMERDGQVVRNRREGYGLVDKMDLIAGRVIGHRDGFGFLVPDEGGDDLFLTARQMQEVMHGDRVLARVSGIDRRGRREGAIVEVLERAHERLVGRYFEESGVGMVVPDNRRINHEIIIPPGEQGGATDGQIVIVELTRQPVKHRQPMGRVVEVVGEHMAPGMEIDIATRSHGLPNSWSSAVEAEIADLSEEVPEQAKAGREELRDLPLVTIDGADSRDFDDAVFCERQGKGWRLIVAIADVASYVKPGSALDREAHERGNSVYFPESVIPMLPEVLSNGLCSINPEVDRLCLACEMRISASGRITRYRFLRGVMRSHARLTYDEVADIVQHRKVAARKQRAELVPQLETLYELYQALHAARVKRGAIDFDSTETRIVFGENRKIERVVPVERNDAHRLIEEMMLAANVSAADYLISNEMPTLFRVHDRPGEERLADLRTFLGELGLQMGGRDKPQAKHYGALMEQIKGRPDSHLIQTVLLRSMMQAVYTPDNIGHFGLAFDAYVHFTSPIRRYPDLLVHRAIHHLLDGKGPDSFAYGHKEMLRLGEHCSMTERRADEATRDAVDWLKCEFMMDRVGETFNGIVTSVTGFGLFVQLQETYVEGLVHVTSLANDYYHFDPVHHRMVGERTRRVYRLGDSIQVRVLRVNLDERKIDFEEVLDEAGRKAVEKARSAPADDEGKAKKKGGGKKRSSGRRRRGRGGKS